MANTVVGVGLASILVLVAAGLAVTFATRGAMAGNHEVVEVLHFVGADDDYIAREFQRRFFKLGLRGSAVGAPQRSPLPPSWVDHVIFEGEPGRRPDRGIVRVLRDVLARLHDGHRHRADRIRPDGNRLPPDGETVS